MQVYNLQKYRYKSPSRTLVVQGNILGIGMFEEMEYNPCTRCKPSTLYNHKKAFKKPAFRNLRFGDLTPIKIRTLEEGNRYNLIIAYDLHRPPPTQKLVEVTVKCDGTSRLILGSDLSTPKHIINIINLTTCARHQKILIRDPQLNWILD